MEITSAIRSDNFRKILEQILDEMDVDSSKIQQNVSEVLNSKSIYVPIRHHSPGSAYIVQEMIKKNKPKLILIEGPSNADALIPYMIHKGTKPPFAILANFSDTDNEFGLNGILSPDISIPAKFQVYYPFISYSPELIAMRAYKKGRVHVHFIDIPLTGLIPYIYNQENETHFLKAEEEQYTISSFYEKLSSLFHFETFNETWDTLFEIQANQNETESLRELLLLFCSAIRETLPDDHPIQEENLIREKYMRERIDYYINNYKVKEEEVLILTGGIHSIALHKTNPEFIDCNQKDLFTALVPYSYYRISQSAGYGSGNQGPRYYDKIWKKFQDNVENAFEQNALDLIVDINSIVRNKGYNISFSDSINSFESAKMLAMLRRRAEPNLKDVIDAVIMSQVKGNPEIEGKYLDKIFLNKIVGHKIGKITKKIGKLPLQSDFYLQFESLGIELTEENQTIRLSLREEEDIKTSYFFWRVVFLDLDIIHRTKGPDIIRGRTGIHEEIWSITWNLTVDIKLIELNIYGSTVEEASKNKLMERVQESKKNFEEISFFLYQALIMGFHEIYRRIFEICEESLNKDDNYLSLSAGFNNLVMILRYLLLFDFQEENVEIIEKILIKTYYSACLALPKMANAPEEIEKKLVDAIRYHATSLFDLRELNLDLTVFRESVLTLVGYTSNHFIKGCGKGVLHLMNKYPLKDIMDDIINYTKSQDTWKVNIGEFVRGVIYECKSKILFNAEIIQILTEFISDISWPIFMNILPSLRKAFNELTSREYEVFSEKVAELYGLKVKIIKEFDRDFSEDTLDFLLEVDKKVREIYIRWFGEEEGDEN